MSVNWPMTCWATAVRRIFRGLPDAGEAIPDIRLTTAIVGGILPVAPSRLLPEKVANSSHTARLRTVWPSGPVEIECLDNWGHAMANDIFTKIDSLPAENIKVIADRLEARAEMDAFAGMRDRYFDLMALGVNGGAKRGQFGGFIEGLMKNSD